jgi:hypothetical protein
LIEARGDKEYVRVGHEMELKGEGGEAVDSTLRKQTLTVERRAEGYLSPRQNERVKNGIGNPKTERVNQG